MVSSSEAPSDQQRSGHRRFLVFLVRRGVSPVQSEVQWPKDAVLPAGCDSSGVLLRGLVDVEAVVDLPMEIANWEPAAVAYGLGCPG